MLAVQRSPPAPQHRLLPWALPSEPAWASPPRGIGFVPVESPPRTVQEYVMQAARPSAPEPQPVCGEEVDAPFLSPVVPSKRAARRRAWPPVAAPAPAAPLA